ncbi:helix-turn-helix transcriptional regulator [Chitinophaga agrisoli]|uniref:Helix-turn-helix transcriptional regulator n=1 Tax=Chitinophaga agrisoli TaxID=2607653 RepID=A0A5B2VKP9_9BACT|nr:helix-turn-helix domain-containing protein [Chitinophaga agrisoli]KAA2239535.1 helix-turn-helix transcriptional regulator [Chitinophaga agrisoli]
MSTNKKASSPISFNEEILNEACSFNEVIRVISPVWKMQILFSIYEGINRFSMLKKEYKTLSDEILGKRLRELTTGGFVEKVDGPDPKHPVVQYFLTQKARELLQLVPSFCSWGDKWL